MPKTIFLLLVVLCGYHTVAARHIKGGWIRYEYLGPGSAINSSSYNVTVHLFVSCIENGPTAQVYLGVFDAVSNSKILTQFVATNGNYSINKSYFEPCLSNPPAVCYRIYTYVTTIELANNGNGYILSVQDALRSANIVNIVNSNNTGITFTAYIPGVKNAVDLHANTSPFFDFTDTAIICYNSDFKYQFSATDIDGDSLSYYLGDGLDVVNPGGNTSSTPPGAPPYPAIKYAAGYSGNFPMGNAVSINEATGLISGTAPATNGEYVLAVYVREWRNGEMISTTKKELHVTVANCFLTAATLKPSYINCDNFSFSFENQSLASNIQSYAWDFGVPDIATDVSNLPKPDYVYPDTGTFDLQLKVTTSAGCADSASSVVKVYPGFAPDFKVAGSCYASPFTFQDATTVKYGTVNKWSWDFGDLSTTSDLSDQKNTYYQYPDPGIRTATLEVSSSKGCMGNVSKTVSVNSKPLIELPFTDTLICSIDTLPLIVQSIGAISWSPNYNIINPGSATPKVFPKQTTTYTVTVTDAGCKDSANIQVHVLDFITVDAGNDAGICKTDSLLLQPKSQALQYSWMPAIAISNASSKNPTVAPLANTTYYVTANLGKCQDKDSITIRVSDYPIAHAGNDTTICYGDMAQLHGSTNAAYFTWSAAENIINENSLNTMVQPVSSAAYVLTVTDTFFCAKPVSDTMLVTVTPQLHVFAGNDTSIVLNQPLQLNATGANTYSWFPATGMNNANIADPIITIGNPIDSIRYTVTGYSSIGCHSSDDVLIKVFTTGADIFVPSGFTPNADGKNDFLKPILVGISTFSYFKIYNRYGQLIFSTRRAGIGWDGKINGQLQSTDTFVYMAAGVDYNGRSILKKGTVVLIR